MSNNDSRNHPDSPAAERNHADAELLARRRFLKGTSLAMPAVMTLTPGTAQALTSITCGQRALDSSLTAECILIPPSNTDDGFMRLPVALYDAMVETTNAQGQTVMEPSNVPTYFVGLHDGQSVWRQCGNGAVVGIDQPEDCNAEPNLMYPTGYAVVHISAETGEIVAVGSPSNPDNAIITSAAGNCMASLAARTQA